MMKTSRLPLKKASFDLVISSLQNSVLDADFSQGNTNLLAATAFTGGQVDFVSFSMTHALQYETTKLIHYIVADSMQSNADDDYSSIDLLQELTEALQSGSDLGHGQDPQHSFVSHPSYRTCSCCVSW
jgi:hypothetical protein